jgi:hypothetical protein
MSEEGFLRRWARRKTETNAGIAPPAEPVPEPALESVAQPAPLPAAVSAPLPQAAPAEPVLLPTMDDVAQLTSESDFSAFVARGVDQAVRRSALKKLFADPHFNVMDKLDMYMDDYNVASPMPEGMLASLKHSKSFFDQAAEDARKRAEAEAGRVLAVPQAPEPALAGQASLVQVQEQEAGAFAGEQLTAPPPEPAFDSADVLETSALPGAAQPNPESAIMMQKQP